MRSWVVARLSSRAESSSTREAEAERSSAEGAAAGVARAAERKTGPDAESEEIAPSACWSSILFRSRDVLDFLDINKKIRCSQKQKEQCWRL